MSDNRPRFVYRGNDLISSPSFHGTKRDVWREVGYPETIEFDQLYTAFKRTLGRAGVFFWPNKCFSVDFMVKDGDSDGQTTQFEKDVMTLKEKHKLNSVFYWLYVYSRVFQYAGVTIAARESATSPDQPLIAKGVDSIVRLTPLLQDRLESSDETIKDYNSPVFGYPEYYTYKTNVTSNQAKGDNLVEFKLDRSRVFAWSASAPPGTIFGTPVNEAGYNYLLNIDKICAAAPEGFWKNARQAPWLTVNDANLAGKMIGKKEEFKDEAEAFARGIDSERMLFGMDVKTLQSTLADPTHPFTINLNAYAATLDNIPATALIGHQTGERASSNDEDKVNAQAKSIQVNILTPMMKEFFQWLIGVNAMTPPTNDIVIEWGDLSESSEDQVLANIKTKAEIDKLRIDSSLDPIFPDHNEIRRDAGYTEIETESFDEDEAEL